MIKTMTARVAMKRKRMGRRRRAKKRTTNL
jgi:hypothetical protein